MKVIWSRDATLQKNAIWNFHADRSVRYADRVETRLEARAATLAQLPKQGRPISGSDLRELSLTDIKYVIVYQIEVDAVRILRLWHTAQDRSG